MRFKLNITTNCQRTNGDWISYCNRKYSYRFKFITIHAFNNLLPVLWLLSNNDFLRLPILNCL